MGAPGAIQCLFYLSENRLLLSACQKTKQFCRKQEEKPGSSNGGSSRPSHVYYSRRHRLANDNLIIDVELEVECKRGNHLEKILSIAIDDQKKHLLFLTIVLDDLFISRKCKKVAATADLSKRTLC